MISGIVPSPFDLPSGCRFEPRCEYAKSVCSQNDPPLLDVGPERIAACIKHRDYAVGGGSA